MSNFKTMLNIILPAQSHSDCMDVHLLGQEGKYQIVRTLQKSLFGRVSLAFDRQSKMQVAVKISRKTRAESQKTRHGSVVVENVRREAVVLQYLAREGVLLCSQYVSQLVEELEDDHFHYLITEYVRGGDLVSLLSGCPEQRLNETEARHIFKQLVVAVGSLHAHQVAHLDLSLENICLDVDQNVKIIDFGVAALHPNISLKNQEFRYFQYEAAVNHCSNESSNPGAKTFPCEAIKDLDRMPGKLSYICPELLTGQQWDAYSQDVFALGVVLYMLLTGHPPFRIAAESDVWFNTISTGEWLNSCVMSQSEAQIYCHLSSSVLSLIDSILKPAKQRITLDEILAHAWMKSSSDFTMNPFR